MSILLIIIHITVCIALIMIVLLQTGKGADMGAAFGGGSSQTLFGSTGASTFLSKATTAAAIIFMVTSLGLAYMSSHRTGESIVTGTPAPVESGEKHIAISMPKYIITKAPAPLDWARLEQPLMGTPRGMAISSSAKNPNAAKLFMDFWLTKEAMAKLSTEVGEYVLASGVFPPIDGMDKAKVIPIRTLSDEEISSYGAMFKKIFELP